MYMEASNALHRNFLSVLVLVCFYSTEAMSQVPLEILPSPATYGPDGPWHAVRVYLDDSSSQTFDLFPGNIGATKVYGPNSCDYALNSGQPCPVIEFYNKNTSAVCAEFNPATGFTTCFDTFSPSYGTADFKVQSRVLVTDGGQALSELSPRQIPINSTLGMLDVGSPEPTVNVTYDNKTYASRSITTSLYSVYNDIPSASFGLHYGSVALGMPLSLYYGGYDSSRIVGSGLTLRRPDGIDRFEIYIRSLDILTLHTAKPPLRGGFNITDIPRGNSSDQIQGLPTRAVVWPGSGFIKLPPEAILVLANQLPITWNDQHGLYLWDTENPLYEKLIKSPTYLSFTFLDSLGTFAGNTTEIRVPFALLNLTFVEVPTDTSLLYFPVRSTDCCGDDGLNGAMVLGRAFLQAAYIGANWRPNSGNPVWWIAQAPGPNSTSIRIPQPILDTSEDIWSLQYDKWEDTWSSYWVLNEKHNSSSLPSTAHQGGSSNSSRIALGVGLGVGLALLIAVVCVTYYHWRRRGRSRRRAENAFYPQDTQSMTQTPHADEYQPRDLQFMARNQEESGHSSSEYPHHTDEDDTAPPPYERPPAYELPDREPGELADTGLGELADREPSELSSNEALNRR